MSSLKEHLDGLMDCGSNPRVIRTRNYDSDLHISSKMIGDKFWISLVEDTYDEEFSHVNVNGDALRELYKVLKEHFEDN